jgi:protein pelota
MEKFFAAVYAAVLRHLPFQTLRAIVIASPGFTREGVSLPRLFSERGSFGTDPLPASTCQMYDYIFQQATLTGNKPLLQSRTKWVKVHSNTSHVHGLVDALRGPEVKGLLEGTKFAKEGVMLEK